MNGWPAKRHIVILTDCLVDLAGGAERQIYELAKGIDKERFHVTVASLECGGAAPARLILAAGSGFEAFPVKRVYGLSGFREGLRFFRYLKKHKVDVVMTYHFSSDVWGTVIAKLAGVPHIMSNRRDIGFWRNKWHVVTYKLINRFVGHFVVNAASTGKMMAEVENIRQDRVHVIPNGINIEPVSPETGSEAAKQLALKRGELVLMHVANIRPVKGHVHLIRAFAGVIHEFPDVKLVLIGEDRMGGEIHRLAEESGTSGHVQFLGKVKGTRAYLPSADICLLPSNSEGLSNAILEYMAAGKPVIATRVGGNGELVEDGVTGLLVEKGDEEGLKAAMLTLLRDEKKRRVFGENGLKKVRAGFSMEAMVGAYEKLFEELPAGRVPAAKIQRHSKAVSSLPVRGGGMKVLHLISSLGLFGAEVVALNLCRYFRRKGIDSVLGALTGSGPESQTIVLKAAEMGVPVAEFPCRGKLNPFAVLKLASYIRENGVSVVHTHNYKSDILGCFAARLAGVPVVATAHGFTDMDHKVSVYEFIDRLFLKYFFPRVVVMTDKMLPGIRSGKKKVIHNGIDFSKEADAFETGRFRRTYGIMDDDMVIGTVGRLSKEKNQILLLRAFFELMRTNQKLKALIVGDGPERDMLKKFATERNLTHRVIFTGIIRDVRPVYQVMNVFVLPSLTEGVPMTILEAMSSKVPVVATKVGAIPELIEEGKTGFLVDSQDKEMLKEKISGLLKNPGLRKTVAELALQEVKKRFSIERMGEEYKKVYEEVLK